MILFPKGWMSELEELVDDRGFTIVGSISQIHKIRNSKNLILYNWDMYSWQDYNSGDWKLFGDLSKEAVDIWYPSELTKNKAREIYGVDKGTVIKMSVPTDWLTEQPIFEDHVILPMRHYHHDKHFQYAQKACDELSIPLVHPDHDLSQEEYLRLLSSSRLILSPYKEASTGGMGVIEGVFLGKTILASDSRLNGTREYLGDYAEYFSNYDDFVKKLKHFYHNPKKIDRRSSKKWVKENYSKEVMAKAMNDRICFISQQADQ